MELLAGTVVDGRYHVVRLLGSGGMARVYAARDERLGVVFGHEEGQDDTEPCSNTEIRSLS